MAGNATKKIIGWRIEKRDVVNPVVDSLTLEQVRTINSQTQTGGQVPNDVNVSADYNIQLASKVERLLVKLELAASDNHEVKNVSYRTVSILNGNAL